MAGVNRISAGTQAIDVPAHSTAQGTQLVGWLWNGGDNQRWNVTADTDGTYTLKNVTSGLCAEVYQNSKAAGAAIDQWACSGDANQRWSATPVTGGYRLTSKSSGLLLTAASTTNGAPLTQQAPSATAVQTWAFTKLS